MHVHQLIERYDTMNAIPVMNFDPQSVLISKPKYHPVTQGENFIDKLKILNERMTQREHIVHASIDYIASLAEHCPVPMWVKDLNGKMMWVNSSFEDIFGIDVNNYVGKSDKDIWEKEFAELCRQNDAHALKDGVWRGIEKTRRKDGHYENNLVLKYRVYDGPTLIGIAGMVCCVFP